MGLGKTLQSICIIAGDHYNREQNYKMTGNADSVPLPSIVICPPTLTGHWLYEVKKFCSLEYLNPIQYVGSPNARAKLQKVVPKHNFIIVSYDIVRNDIDFFKEIHWNYCVLDEGHIIKNTKTKITKAIKLLKANHRLILSGTPIQNNVLELWSLFDFLMPGFLGTERQFNERYGRPILLSRDAKSSSKEQEAGALAMESLHKQVLPFLLRRMKEDVLQDLPPKIIQDYHCDLSPLQVTNDSNDTNLTYICIHMLGDPL
jgi:TATA-binding protein-associated factor